MKCEYCGGTIIFKPGNSVEPDRAVCMACGREPKEKEKKMDEKTKKCTKCKKDLPATNEFFHTNSLRSDGFETKCKKCKKCRNEYQRNLREHTGGGNGRKRRIIHHRNKKSDPPVIPTTKATPAEILIALRRGMAQEIVDIIKEKYDL